VNASDKFLFVGPHPDDVFISCGGLILKSKETHDIDVCCVVSRGMSPSDEVRINEERKAWHLVDDNQDHVKLFLFPGVDTEVQRSYNQLVDFIEQALSKNTYKYIFVPYGSDTHQDHRSVSEACLSACRYAKNIIFYETPSTYDFSPTMFVELSDDVMRFKRKISNCYESQLLGTENYSVDLQTIIESKAISNGIRSRVCKYAEGFKPFRMFI
jgi:LmbE family N-acetylglucosaminyl deacetylase